MAHKTVMLQETIDMLGVCPGDVFLDCTLDNGGHSEEVAKRFGTGVTILGIDMDEDALARAEERLKKAGANFALKQSNFRNLDRVLAEVGIGKVNRIVFDLGLSSEQLEDSGRGFTFQKDEPLLMTFKKKSAEDDITAKMILNDWEENTIADIIFGYGEERYARKIAKAIVEYRKNKKIETTNELVEIVKSAVPPSYQHGKMHFATKTFQALRMAVNDELMALREALEKAYRALAPCGRMAVISFHSIEDREVKQFFRKMETENGAILLTKKPAVPSEGEVKDNPRSRSAKLRVLQKALEESVNKNIEQKQ